MRRLSTRIDTRLAVNHLSGKRINLLVADAVVAPLPSLAEIRAGVNLAAIGPAEQRLGHGLKDDRAEMLARNHRAVPLPRAAALLKRKDAVDSADE